MIFEALKRSIQKESAATVLALGLCPALAVSNSALGALGMGIIVVFVLTCASAIISLVRKWIPQKIRTSCFTIIITVVVVIADSWMKAARPDMSDRLGIFVPLLAANCLILTRVQIYASKNNVIASIIDGIVIGLGYAAALFVIGAVREILGNNTLFGITVFPGFRPVTLFAYAPGGFFILAAMMWTANRRRLKNEREIR